MSTALVRWHVGARDEVRARAARSVSDDRSALADRTGLDTRERIAAPCRVEDSMTTKTTNFVVPAPGHYGDVARRREQPPQRRGGAQGRGPRLRQRASARRPRAIAGSARTRGLPAASDTAASGDRTGSTPVERIAAEPCMEGWSGWRIWTTCGARSKTSKEDPSGALAQPAAIDGENEARKRGGDRPETKLAALRRMRRHGRRGARGCRRSRLSSAATSRTASRSCRAPSSARS